MQGTSAPLLAGSGWQWLAVGIAETGSAAAGIIYPVIFTNLIDKVRFGSTV
jgi:hypothetical protein